jgi:AcrR family transcriptional regulator
MPRPDTPPARGRRRWSVDARRQQLLQLGVAAFSAEAFDVVAIDAIATQAGISKGLLYHYFPNKRAFFVACVKQAAADMLALTAPPDDLPPLEALEVGLDAFLDYVQAHRLPYRNLLRGDVNDPEVAAVIDETRAQLVARVTAGMGLRPDAVGRLALWGWVGFVEAVTVTWLGENAGEPPVSAEAIKQLILQALAGLVPSCTDPD